MIRLHKMYINKSFLSTFFFVKLLGIPAMALKIRDHNHQILKEIIVLNNMPGDHLQKYVYINLDPIIMRRVFFFLPNDPRLQFTY